MICDGVTSQPGGAGKVDQWVFDRLKLDDAWRIQGVVDPRRKLIRWLLPSKATGKLDLMVVLNEATGWWAYCDGYDLGVLGHSITTAKLVDDIDELLDGSDISELRLDDPIWSGDNIRSLAAFDSTGRFGSLSGPALEAEIMTSERQLADGQQALVNELWPLVDGAPAEAALGTRKTLGQPIVWTGYKAPNRVGFCPLRGRSSYHSARVRVPAGVDWKFAQGVRMPFRPAGRG